MKFEWDENKDSQNLKKHGIRFSTAREVFFDPFRIETMDDINSTYEDRFITIGKVREILFVVYTIRNDRIRLISARKADRREEKLYYDSLLSIR